MAKFSPVNSITFRPRITFIPFTLATPFYRVCVFELPLRPSHLYSHCFFLYLSSFFFFSSFQRSYSPPSCVVFLSLSCRVYPKPTVHILPDPFLPLSSRYYRFRKKTKFFELCHQKLSLNIFKLSAHFDLSAFSGKE